MLNKNMKKEDVLSFISVVFFVFLIYQLITLFILTRTPELDTSELINKKQVSPQELYDESWKSIEKNYVDTSFNSQDWKRWRNRYRGKLKTEEDARVAIETMVASLNDIYTRFLPQKEYEEQFNSIDSHITGIGVNITSRAGKTVIHSVLEGTPAQKADLRAEDIILYVDGKDINGIDLYKVSEMVRGPENTVVILRIKRGRYFVTKKIKREKIEIKSIESSIKKGNIGYIKIKSFIGTNTSNDFSSAIASMKNTKGIILDLRDNPGGLFGNALFVANTFIKDGKIVSIVTKNGKKDDVRAIGKNDVITKPTVVLVNGSSASASEIVSGALKDNKKAILVGTKTFGKGLVQKIVPLPNRTGINITIAKYLTPNGSDINKIGIEPDYKVEYTLKDMVQKNDTQLKKAEAIINSISK